MNSNTPFKIVSGTRSRYLAEEIAKNLGVELGKMNIQYFADGEFVLKSQSVAARYSSCSLPSLTATI